jgi:hypothetical protein
MSIGLTIRNPYPNYLTRPNNINMCQKKKEVISTIITFTQYPSTGSESQHVIYKRWPLSTNSKGFSPFVQPFFRTCPLYRVVLSLVVGLLLVADFPATLPDWTVSLGDVCLVFLSLFGRRSGCKAQQVAS